MISELADQIWSHDMFHKDLEALERTSLAMTLGCHVEAPIDAEGCLRLLQSAVALAPSPQPRHRHAAQQIVAGIWETAESHSWPKSLQGLLKHLLEELSFFPAVKVLQRIHGDADHEATVPPQVFFRSLFRRRKNTVQHGLVLTDFQLELWEALQRASALAVNAPTSCGKSFVLQNFLVKRAVNFPSLPAVYLAPTRALLSQISASLNDILSAESGALTPLTVSTVPVLGEEADGPTIFVLTQERLQLLLDENPDVVPSIVVVDESQGIDDGARGILLQDVIERLHRSGHGAPLLFGSPFAANPDVFRDTFELGDFRVVETESAPVLQTLVHLRTTSPDEVLVSWVRGSGVLSLGAVSVPGDLSNRKRRLASLAWRFGGEGLSLVYGNGPAECEKITEQLLALLVANPPEVEPSHAQARQEFADFVRQAFHQDYLLATAVESGVAFHFGNMPSVLRKGIEKLAGQGALAYLVSTSTLLQGVNLPARSLFLHAPTKGKKTPLTGADFWNLAGRAGRLGKEFRGLVFLVDEDEWEERPSVSRKKRRVRPAFQRVVVDDYAALLTFVGDSEHPSGRQPDLESAFMKLHREDGAAAIDLRLEGIGGAGLSALQREKLAVAIGLVQETVSLPRSLVQRNLAVSALRQQDLFDYLLEKIRTAGPRSVIPLHPLSGGNFYESLWRLFKRIHSQLERLPGKDKSHFFYARLAKKWILGATYGQLIAEAIQAKAKKLVRGTPSVATEAREVFASIESNLRFRYVKYTRCYNDLLAHALATTGNGSLARSIPAIPLYLELGASSNQMLSLMAEGLSRTSSTYLADLVPAGLTRSEFRSWARRYPWSSSTLPAVVRWEIQRQIGQ